MSNRNQFLCGVLGLEMPNYKEMPMRAHVYPTWEVYFDSLCGLVKIPDDFCLFTGGIPLADPINILDHGYEEKSRGNYWSLYQMETPEWVQLSGKTWSFFHKGYPEYVVTFFTSDEGKVVSPFEEVESVSSTTIWIPNEATLQVFLTYYPLVGKSVASKEKESEIVELLLGGSFHASFPTPQNYIHHYWQEVSIEERISFCMQTLSTKENL